ncbi:hypothetical protein OF83DRAFT_9303 [Amylostereum chailletii]|nr:hypothetical protein OF83DRAFT_9303 [Amylostereum chailletii]
MPSFNYTSSSTPSSGLAFFPVGPAAPHAFSGMQQSPSTQYAMFAALAQSTKQNSSNGSRGRSDRERGVMIYDSWSLLGGHWIGGRKFFSPASRVDRGEIGALTTTTNHIRHSV